MGCQHGNGYKRCQGSKSKLLLAGSLRQLNMPSVIPKTQPHPTVPSTRSNTWSPLHATQLPPTTPGSHKRHNRLNQSPYSRHDASHRSSTPPRHPTLFPIFYVTRRSHVTELQISILFSTLQTLYDQTIRYPPTSTVSIHERRIFWYLRV